MTSRATTVSSGAQANADRRSAGPADLTLVAVMAFLTVVDLFAAQALLPSLATKYDASPAEMGLAVNACTLGMAIGGLAIARHGHVLPRRNGIALSLGVLAVPTLALALAPDILTFAALRVLQGFAMAAAFGLTLAHLGESFDERSTASVFAAYITGNVGSNLVGRLLAAAVAEHTGLSGAFLAFAGLNLAGALLAVAALAETKGSRTVAAQAGPMASWAGELLDPRLCAAFGIGFLILFSFIGTFTFVNFVLARPPLGVSMMQLGLVYFVFLPSILTTPFAGRLGQRLGSRRGLQATLAVAAIGLPLLLAGELALVLLGMTLVAVGTFAAQALATGYVSRTALRNRAAASGVYLCSYFLGGMAGSAILGQLFDRLGWTATVLGIGLALSLAIVLARATEKSDYGAAS